MAGGPRLTPTRHRFRPRATHEIRRYALSMGDHDGPDATAQQISIACGKPSGNPPLTREEISRLFGCLEPEIRRLQAERHKRALPAARDLALLTTLHGWGLRRREAARLETHDWRRQAKLPEFGDLAALAVRWRCGGASPARGSRPGAGW
jgi:integrase